MTNYYRVEFPDLSQTDESLLPIVRMEWLSDLGHIFRAKYPSFQLVLWTPNVCTYDYEN